MFRLLPAPPPLDPGLLERYSRLEPVVVGHRVDTGFAGVEIQALGRRQHVVGRALTVRLAGIDSTAVHRAVDLAAPGDVIVVDHAGETQRSCWGGTVTRAAAARGVRGAVLDGPACDVEDIEAQGFPVWCRGRSLMTTRVIGWGGEIWAPVRCGLAAVQPGDLVLGDDNGVFFLSPQAARDWIDRLEQVARHADEMDRQIRAGASLSEISGARKLFEGGNSSEPPPVPGA